VTNTLDLAYSAEVSMTAQKRFICLTIASIRVLIRRQGFDRPGVNVIKLFTVVIYGFYYKATMFVGLGWRGLLGINTLANYEILKLRTKEVLKHWPQVSML
jgi:hypothetical protein